MKKLLTICLIVATTFTVNAQDGKPTFEETVEYINSIFKENRIDYFNGNSNYGYNILGIKADKSGKIIIYNKYKNEIETTELEITINAINLFDIDKYFHNDLHNSLYLKGLNNSQIGQFSNMSPPQSARFEKALKYLQTLCSRKNDPFAE